MDNVTALLEDDATKRMFQLVVALEGESAEASQARAAFWQARFAAGSSILTRAVDRGEIAAPADPVGIIEMLVGTAYVRAFVSGRRSSEAQRRASVRAALELARAEAEPGSGVGGRRPM